ncbi:hypothetical protein LTR62_005645 [Meristemomyces frigidus]|uniref:Zn(2)-C6 fungal-type domain-containing protein n=1 Tax=Meristemomyces frigidus TaxID=1508187 RepID=A0AAN7TCP3_9PEZI|nr:hypothetical protein LTR62_005645 [Meristemomyces frigidus]
MSTATAPTHVQATNGMTMGRLNTAISGFTAVNSESQGSPSQVVATRDTIDQEKHRGDAHRTATQHSSQGWRPRGGSVHTTQPDGKDARKRKRSVSASVTSPGPHMTTEFQVERSHSPTRHVANLDSAVDLSPPGNMMNRAHAPSAEGQAAGARHVAPSSREPSPVRRWAAAEPVPPPRPEIEADLAESLQRVLHNPPAPHESTATAVSQRSERADARTTPPVDDVNHMHSQSYSPEKNSGEYDAKKRKRNFSNRTKTGCHTCRERKKKCDELKPKCVNCLRGNYACGGYGPKPPVKDQSSSTRAPTALKSKPGTYEPSHGPSTYFQSPVDAPRYSPWGRIPEPIERPHIPLGPPQPYSRDCGPEATAWPHTAEPPPSHIHERLPATDFPPMPPLNPYGPGHSSRQTNRGSWSHEPSSAMHFRSSTDSTGYGPALSSRDSASTTSSQRTAALALAYGGSQHLPEKQKMLLGLPFMPYRDSELLSDRDQCKAALERYNDSALASRGHSSEERARFFRAIVEPPFRETYKLRHAPDTHYSGPKGSVGPNTYVETPFTCDYGFNIHLGEEVLIQPGCYMQDACEISIGARTIIGPNVKFYGTTTSVDASQRKGSQGNFVAGAIRVGDDCFIGGDAIIMPFRKIGNGAVVGAGSVVTKDVKENTVVAGNPAKFIRRIVPGHTGQGVDGHHNSDIQEQNHRMLGEMREEALKHPDR